MTFPNFIWAAAAIVSLVSVLLALLTYFYRLRATAEALLETKAIQSLLARAIETRKFAPDIEDASRIKLRGRKIDRASQDYPSWIAAMRAYCAMLSMDVPSYPPPSAPLESSKPWMPWAVALVLFVCEMIGVWASFYVTRVVFAPGQNPILAYVVVGAVNFATTFGTRPKDTPIVPLDLFQYVKDGFLWPAALPALAKVWGYPST